MRKLNIPQRIVIVVALGVILWALGAWINSGSTSYPTGWTGYAPLTTNPPIRLGSLVELNRNGHLAVWVVLTAVWMLLSLLILRTRKQRQERAGDDEQGRDSGRTSSSGTS